MMNIKQKELCDEFYLALKEKFPEVELINITESPENSRELWLHITDPHDDDQEIEIREFAAQKSTEILLNYGYPILISFGDSWGKDTALMVNFKKEREIGSKTAISYPLESTE